MNSNQRIGVVTVTYNSSAVLTQFLDSVWNQTQTNFLLYIVDSASTDGTRDRVCEISDPRVRLLVRRENVGFAAGSNLGIKAALEESCTAILLLNNDTVFGPNLFQQLCDGLETHACDMTTPKVYYNDEPNKIWAAGGYFRPWFGYRTQHYGYGRPEVGQYDTVRTVQFTPFCCVLIRAEVFRKIGYLDAAYFVYVEDEDYCYRAMKAGFVMKYLPNCQLWHKVSSLTGGMSDFTVRYCMRNRVYFLYKNLFKPLAHAGTVAYFSYLWSRHLFIWIRYMTGKDSEAIYRLKLSAHNEGSHLCNMSMKSNSSKK